jgi:hypothetical protein
LWENHVRAHWAVILAVTVTVAGCPDSNREDLSSWRQTGAPVWHFADGVAEAGPAEQHGFLVSRNAYDDFRLSVEFWIEDNTNSGVFIRCTEPVELADLNPDNCYEINIWDNHPNQDFRTGSIVTLTPPLARVDTLGRWNRFDIAATGNRIEVTLNGVKVASLVNDRSASGYLALQYAGSAGLMFRNLQLTALSPGGR